MEIFKSFPHAELSQPQIIYNLEIVKDIFTGRDILVSNNQQHGNILMSFWPAELFQSQIIIIPKKFKDFFECGNLLDADQRHPETFQRLCHRQKNLRRKLSTTWKHSKPFSPAELSSTQVIKISKLFKDFFACRIVLAADQRYPETIQRHFHRQKYLSLKSSTTWKYSKTFHLQISLSRKSSTTWKYSKPFSPAKLSWPQIIKIPKLFKDFFRLQNCLSRRSSKPRKYSKTFSPADLSWPQIINNLTRRKSRLFSPAESSWPQIIDTPKIFKDFFTCRTVLAASLQQHGNIQRPFTCRIHLATNYQQPGNIQSLFRLQNCLRRKSSISQNYSKSFSHAELS